jgi:putative phosphoesterase
MPPNVERAASVVVISDTHVPRFRRFLPDLLDALSTVRPDAILHCGDWTDPALLDELRQIAPTHGVAGNNDRAKLHETLGTQSIVEVAGARFGITHGHLGAGRTTEERAVATFLDEPQLAAVLFGHSHIPLVRRLPSGTWLVNPGSPTDKRRQPERTFALISIQDGAIFEVEIRRIA